MIGLAPSLLLALFGAWCGTFASGTTFIGFAAAAVSLLGTWIWIGVPARDPLRLGEAGRLLPIALWIAVAASDWASPVSRAGWVAVILVPAFLGFPAVVEHCWRREADRRWGLRALALVVAGVSLWALGDWLFLASPRPAMPLGHHNLLAAWLAILIPLAVLPVREASAWRLAGWAAGGLALAAILASRSLAGLAAVAAEALVGFGLRAPAKLAELDFIHRGEDGGLRIGALVRQRRLERDSLVAEVAPLLHEAVPFVAHPQIRNRGTLGGSLAHADPAAELPAIAVALRARLLLRRTGGERWVEARNFFAGLFSTALEPDEILAEVAIPPLPPGTGWAFLEIARRHGDYAQVGIAALVTLDESGRCREARLVYLSVGDAPVEARGAARLLAGQELSPAAIEAAAEKAARDEIDPRGDVHATPEFKRHLARVLTGRALRQAAERARNGRPQP